MLISWLVASCLCFKQRLLAPNFAEFLLLVWSGKCCLSKTECAAKQLIWNQEGKKIGGTISYKCSCRCLSQEVTAANSWPLKICPMLNLTFVPELLILLLKYWLCAQITCLNQRREVSKKLMYNHYSFCLEASSSAYVACHNSSDFIQLFTFWI